MNLICGKSAKGKTRLLIGPFYSISFRGWDTNEIATWAEPPLPAELAWTKMHTGWSHKRK